MNKTKDSKPPTVGSWWTLAIICLFCLISGFNASAQESATTEIQQDENGGYYATMPKEGTTTVNVGTDVTYFFIRGDKSQTEYTPGCDGTLIITAPEGNFVRIIGHIKTDLDKARLEITDLGDESNPKMLGSFHSTDYDPSPYIDVLSSSNKVAIRLHSFDANSDPEKCTINLNHVEIIDGKTQNPVNVYSSGDGTITADKESAQYGETVTITTKPGDGYYLNNLRLDYASHTEYIDASKWSTGESIATFTMPPVNARITAVFETVGNLSAEFPKSGTREAVLPAAGVPVLVTTDGYLTGASDGYLHLKAPEGEYALQISGNMDLYEDQSITIYDGDNTNAEILFAKEKGKMLEYYNLSKRQSSGRDLLIHYSYDNESASQGSIGLFVSAVGIGNSHYITIYKSENGAVTTEATTAESGGKVTIKVNPDEGYLLSNIRILDNSGSSLDHTEYTWYDGTNQMSFVMPDGEVNISAEFAKEYGDEDSYGSLYSITMDKSKNLQVPVPEGLKNFFISGGNDQYFNNVDATIVLTAQSGKTISFTGQADFGDTGDYIDIYDGSKTDSKKLIDHKTREENSEEGYFNANTSGNTALISYHTNEEGNDGYGLYILCEVSDPMLGTGTESDPYQITSASQWKMFAAKVNDGSQNNACAKLMNDITVLITEPSLYVGSEAHPYTGTFDGNEKRLRIQALIGTSTENSVAPFNVIDGATIKNLDIAGTMQLTCDVPFVGGIVGQVGNKGGSLRSCMSQTYIMSPNKNTIGGIAGVANGPLTIEDCLDLNTYIERGSETKINGMIGAANAATTITNCLVNSDYNNDDELFNIFSADMKNITLKNSYYGYQLSAHSVEPQGIEASLEDLLYGKTLEQLQNGRTDASHWAKYLFDNSPHPFRSRIIEEGSENWSDDYVYYDTKKGNWFVYRYNNYMSPSSTNYAFDLKAGEYVLDRTLEGSTAEPALYTLCVPFDVDMTQQNFKAYRLSGINETGDSVSFVQVKGKLEASKPYLIEVTEEMWHPSFNDVMIYSKEPTPVKAGDITMTGVYRHYGNNELAKLGAYQLQSDNLWHPVHEDGDASLDHTRAYLTFGSKEAAKAFAMTFSDGETTGVSTIKTIDNDGSIRYYDLSGRYIGSTLDGARKGVYITNKGKKVTK